MNLERLISRFRVEAEDTLAPYLWEDEWLIDWLNEAQAEAALRARLLLDDFTPAVCQIAVTAGEASYALHSKAYEIATIAFKVAGAARRSDLDLVSREKLDRICPEWRDLPARSPRFAIQTDSRLRLVPVPDQDGMLLLEAYRLPLKQLANDQDKPEIHEAHHLHLVQWALFRAFSKPDADARDPQRAATAYEAFERYFGPLPDADLRRATRQDEAHANVGYY